MGGSGTEALLRKALAGRRVLVTGHSGFKGGWLSLWLKRLGAEVIGVALPAPQGPSFFDAVRLNEIVDDRIGDIRWAPDFDASVADVDADLIIHMAAQALVRPSYDSPIDTYQTNVIGTAVVLEAARRMKSLKAVIVVTSDKCYDNQEWPWGYRESDALGGGDPYSSSKGCAEIVAAAYRRSFFSRPDSPPIATVRAGNVFGGGDWAVDRIVPDIMRAIAAGQPVPIRNPRSTRPWQHVLEPVLGYLMLAERLLSDGQAYAGAWNFGPAQASAIDVETLARGIASAWGAGASELLIGDAPTGPHEAMLLRLDSGKALARLGWQSRLSVDDAIRLTVDWYRAHHDGRVDMRALTEAQIDSYLAGGAGAAVPDRLPRLRAVVCA